MNPYYDLSMENFSSLYLDNHYLSDTQEPMRAGITHVLKVGFSSGIKWDLDSKCEDLTVIRKAKFKLIRQNYDILHNRLYGDGRFLSFKEMCQSTLKSDVEAVNYANSVYPDTISKKTIVSFYVVGFYFGICYSVHRMNKICKGKGVIEIKDSDLPDFIKEYIAYTKKHTKKG